MNNNNNNNKKNNKNNVNKNNDVDSSKLIYILLQLRNQMKLYHWQTESYARHKASDKFLKKVTDIIDRLVEAYQGKYGTIYLNNKNKEVKLDNISNKDIVKYLETVRKYMKEDASILLANDDTDMYNLRDEIIENINITLYLFRQK